MSKYYVITHFDNNDNFIPINNKNHTEDWVEAIETAREYISKHPDEVVEAVEEGGYYLRVVCTKNDITVINSFPFYWAEYQADVDTQTILEDVHPG